MKYASKEINVKGLIMLIKSMDTDCLAKKSKVSVLFKF